jgi:hypothetical protein
MPPRVSRRLLAFQLRLNVLGNHTDLFHDRLQLIRRAAKFPTPVLHLVVFVHIDAFRVLWSGFGFIVRNSANRITGEYGLPPQPTPIRFLRTFLRLLTSPSQKRPRFG